MLFEDNVRDMMHYRFFSNKKTDIKFYVKCRKIKPNKQTNKKLIFEKIVKSILRHVSIWAV